MLSCTDFEEEEMMLQMMGCQMAVEIDRTPKCHCEIAGEGIEYSWACSKNHFRKILLEKKRGKENFTNCVRECVSRNLLTTERIQKFSKRARCYMQGYHILNQMQQGLLSSSDADELMVSETKLTIIPTKLEQMVKKFKTHRCAMDFDYSFCKTIYKEDSPG